MGLRTSKLSEEEEMLVRAIEQLPDAHASLIIMHYLENESFEEIGKKLNLSDKEISLQHHAALSALRRWMHKFDGI
jgi:RNA polymerase sigma factor (sigma-70 family)